MKMIEKAIRKITTISMVFAMILVLFPSKVLAVSVPDGSSVTKTYDLSENDVIIDNDGTYVITQSGTGPTSNTITINDKATIYLDGVNILVPHPDDQHDNLKPNPINIIGEHSVKLYLVDGSINTLESEAESGFSFGSRGSSKAGLRVPEGATLDIYGNTGELNTSGAVGFNYTDGAARGGGGAGIGGNGGYVIYINNVETDFDAEASGTVNVFGGIINATGGDAGGYWGNGGPGIGGGGARHKSTDGVSGTVYVENGYVTAIGGSSGSGSDESLKTGYAVSGGLTIKGGTIIGISATQAIGIRSPFSIPPVLLGNYLWRTNSAEEYTQYSQDPDKAYVSEVDQRFVEIIVIYSPTISISANPTSGVHPADVELTATLIGADTNVDKLIHFYKDEELFGSTHTNNLGEATIGVNNLGAKSYSFYARFDGNDVNSYAQSTGFNFTVAKGEQSVSFTDPSDINKTYGDLSFNLSTVTGGTGTGAYSYRSNNESVATVSEGHVTITGAGEATVYVKKLGDDNYNDSAEANIRVTVAQKPVTISGVYVEEKEYDGTFDAEIITSSAKIDGTINSDAVSIDYTNASATFSDKNVREDIQVTFDGFALSGANATNYVLESQPSITSANITPRKITVSGITASDKVYDGKDGAALSFSSINFVHKLESDSLTLTATGTFKNTNVGDNIEIDITELALSGTSSSNYVLSQEGQQTSTTANITPATITVTPDSGQSKYYGQTDPEFSYESSGAVMEEIPDFTGSLSRVSGESIASNYQINLGSLVLNNNPSFEASNYQLAINESPVTFEIKEYSTSAVATTTPNGENGWFKSSPITLNAPAGYLISTSNALESNVWGNSIEINDSEGVNKPTNYYLKGNTTLNQNAISTSKTLNYNVDKTAPTDLIISYDVINTGTLSQIGNFLTFGNFFKEGVKISVAATDATSGLSKLYYSIKESDGTTLLDEQNVNFDKEEAAFTISFADVKDNQDITVEVFATDTAGNSSIVQVLKGNNENEKWTFENTVPVIGSFKAESSVIVNNQWLNTASVPVTVNITDDTGIYKISYKVDDDTEYRDMINGLGMSGVSTTSYDFSVIIVGEGAHTIDLLVTDNAMNTSTKTISFKIDSIKPKITTVTGNAETWQNTDVTLTVHASDDGSGLATDAYSFDGGITWQAENYKVYTENQTIIANTIMVKDGVGNTQSYTTSIDVTTIDKENPEDPIVKLNDFEPKTDWYTAYPVIEITEPVYISNTAYETTYYKLWNTSDESTNTEPEDAVVLNARVKRVVEDNIQPTIDSDGIWMLKTWTEDAANNSSLPSTITIKVDTTVPDGDIFIEENSVKALLMDITFGLFYNKNIDVRLTASDDTSGVENIEYIKSVSELDEEELNNIDSWIEYTSEFSETAVDASKFIYYIKITDNAANVSYIASNRITFDTTPPEIHNITDRAIYYVDQIVSVTDTNLLDVTLNDNAFESGEKLEGNTETTYVLIATDKAGNSKTFTVEMKSIASLSLNIDSLTVENVTLDNKIEAEEVKSKVEEVLVTTKNGATQEQIDALNNIMSKCNELLDTVQDVQDKITDVENKTNGITKENVKSIDQEDLEAVLVTIIELLETYNLTDDERTALELKKKEVETNLKTVKEIQSLILKVYESVQEVTEDNVVMKDRETLEKAFNDLHIILKDKVNNLTSAEIKDIKDKMASIKSMIDTLEEVSAVEGLINALPSASDVTKANADAIFKAQEAYVKLSDHQKGMINATLKTKLATTTEALRHILLFDTPTGIKVEGTNGTVFDLKTELVVTELMDTLDKVTMGRFALSVNGLENELQLLQLYDIKLMLDGVVIQPNGMVKVTLPLSDNLKDYSDIQIVFIEEDGTVTRILSTVEDNEITFMTDHFSYYGIVGTPINSLIPDTSNPINNYTWWIMLLGSLLVVLTGKKKEEETE